MAGNGRKNKNQNLGCLQVAAGTDWDGKGQEFQR